MYARDVEGNFVRHVALLVEKSTLLFGNNALVWQMRPPLVVGERSRREASEDGDRCEAHLAGFTDLDLDDFAGIQTWLAEVDKERRPQGLRAGIEQYTVHPPVVMVTDRISGVVRYRKFSCVGLVLECYRNGAGINLIDWKSEELPEVTLDSIVSIYGEELRSKEKVRESWGIPGDGPWRVALAGYVLHALDRPVSEVREAHYIPKSSDEGGFPVNG